MAITGFNTDDFTNSVFEYAKAEFTEWATGKTVADVKEIIQNLYPDADGLTAAAEAFYTDYGAAWGLSPNAYFNVAEYRLAWAAKQVETNHAFSTTQALTAYDAALAGEDFNGDAYAHYLAQGAAMGVNPSNAFDESDYLQSLIDGLPIEDMTVAALRAIAIKAGITPLDFFVDNSEFQDDYPAIEVTGDEIVYPDSTVTLTHSVDHRTANIFDAPRVWNPDDSDQMNSLNDDDVLTGTDSNPTLNFTFVNDTETEDMDIMPELNGIQIINVDFTADVDQTLDLQDATGVKVVNAARIDDALTASVVNMTQALTDLSISNSNSPTATFNASFLARALTNTPTIPSNSLNLELSNAQLAQLTIEDVAGVFGTVHTAGVQGYENINLNSTGAANVIALMCAEDLTSLIITGDQNLTINALPEAGSLTTVDASALAASLTFTVSPGVMVASPDGTSNGNVAFTLTGTKNNDTITIVDQVGANDKLIADDNAKGDDTDTIIMTNTASTAFFANTTTAQGTAAQATGFEAARVIRAADGAAVNDRLTVDLDQMEGDQTILLSNLESDNSTVTYKLDNATAAEATAITITHSGSSNIVGGDNAITQNIIDLDVATGVTAAGVTIVKGLNNEPRFNFTLTADSDSATGGVDLATVNTVASIKLTDADDESNSVLLPEYLSHTGTLTVDSGVANNFLNLDAINVANGNGFGVDQAGDAGALTPNNLARTATAASDAAFAAKYAGTVYDGEPLGRSQVGYVYNDIGVATPTTAQRIIAGTIDAANFAGDLIVRVGDKNQTITTGTGNDTVIFDAVLPTDNSRLTAGLNISDKVAMGTGIDTIIIDGNVGATEVIGLDATEWTNVSGVDVIRFGTAGAGTYRLALTNQLINQSDANNGQRITVINSDGSLITDVNSDVTIDMRQLDNSHFVDFYGSNAMSNTSAADGVGDDAVVNTIRVTEVTMSGNSNLNGGENTVFSLPGTTAYTTVGLSELILNGTIPATAIPATSLDAGLAWAVACNTKTAAEAADEVKAENTENPNSGAFTTPAHFALFDEAMATEGNSNILEIYNNAEITAGDLANVSNFSTIKFINDLGTSQLLNMTLTDSIVDALVDASHTSTATQTELLTVGAYDNLSNGSGSFARVNIQGSNLTGRSDVQILLGRGQDVVQTGAGDDVVVMAGNYIKGKYVALDPTTGFDMNSVANWDDDSDDDNDGIVDDADKNGVNEDTMTQLAVTDTVALGVGSNDTLITYGAIDFTGANITGVESLISYSDVTMTASQYAQFGRITFAGNITHTLTIVDNLLGNNAIDASTLVLYDNSANLSIDLTSFSNAAGGNVNNQTVIGTPTDKSDIGNIIIDANLPPVAVADTFTTANNVPIKIDVLKNDYDLNTTDVLTILSITDVSNTDGQVKINSDNTVTFTPASGYVGDASFQYAVSDGKTASTGTVTGKITAATSTYALTAAAASVSEGAPATFNLVTTNVVDGTDVAYTLTGIQAADVDGGALTGTVKVIGNAATINVPLLADKATEGVETLTVTVNTATASTIINDTSTAIPTVEVDIADFTNNAYAAQDGAENITIAAASWSGKILTVSAFDNIEDRLIIDGGWADVDAFIADNAAGAAGAFGVDAQGDIHIYSPNFDEILLTGVNAQASTTLTGAVDAGWISFA